RIGVVTAAQLNMAQRDVTPGARARAEGAESPLVVTLDEQPGSVLLACSVPVDGRCLCALALIGDTPAPARQRHDRAGREAGADPGADRGGADRGAGHGRRRPG